MEPQTVDTIPCSSHGAGKWRCSPGLRSVSRESVGWGSLGAEFLGKEWRQVWLRRPSGGGVGRALPPVLVQAGGGSGRVR